jgi:hypothetical protein
MVAVRKMRPDRAVSVGPLLEADKEGLLIPCNATLGRSEDMQKLFQLYPYLTGVDVRPCLDAWAKGYEFHARQMERKSRGRESAIPE